MLLPAAARNHRKFIFIYFLLTYKNYQTFCSFTLKILHMKRLKPGTYLYLVTPKANQLPKQGNW